MRLSVNRRHRAGEYKEGNKQNQTKNHENRGDHSADFSSIGVAAATRIHQPGIHFLQVVIAHDPRGDAKWPAHDQADNAKNQN